jgi:hypothetical protein
LRWPKLLLEIDLTEHARAIPAIVRVATRLGLRRRAKNIALSLSELVVGRLTDIIARLRAKARTAGIDLSQPFFFPPEHERFSRSSPNSMRSVRCESRASAKQKKIPAPPGTDEPSGHQRNTKVAGNGRPMMKPPRKGRGRPFKPGNRGRPPGSKNKTTRIVEQLAEGQAEQLVQKVMELALAGDVSCLRMMLDRLCPPRKGQPVNIVMPPINTSQDVLPAIASIWTAICDGRLTPEEAGALSIVVDRTIQAIELHDITKRVAALEEARGKPDEENDPPPA